MAQNTSGGFCECGCGEPAPISPANYSKKGYVKGEPRRFVQGHCARVQGHEWREKLSQARRGRKFGPLSAEHREKIAVTKRGERHYGWKGGNVSRISLHEWLRGNHPKTGRCEECGDNVGPTGHTGTQYSFLRHPAPHTRNRGDYRELCPRCHNALDFVQRTAARWPNWKAQECR